jgi:hypothetical protein
MLGAERVVLADRPVSADPYLHSTAVRIISERLERGEQPRLALLDIDSTLTGSAEAANEVRQGLESHGFAIGFVTSRTEEMIMSSDAFALSRTVGFRRPPPKLGGAGDEHAYTPPERVLPAGLLDGDVIAASSGTQILLKQEDGAYLPDRDYEARFDESPEGWRAAALALLDWIQSLGCRVKAAPIEHPESYEEGRSDVFPPQYRVQVNFPTLDDKAQFVGAVKSAQHQSVHGAPNVRLTDDSNPVKERFKLFLTPRRASKARAAETIVSGVCSAAHMERDRLTILYAGDSFPDLTMGLLGGLGTNATLFLAGGSRLVPHLVGNAEPVFAGEPLAAFRRRLTPTGENGKYRFRLPAKDLGERYLVVGDEMFPGLRAAESVAAYVKSAAR